VGVTGTTAVVEDPRYRDHTAPGGHPERPERLLAVGRAISARAGRLRRLEARPATDDEILRVHDRAHLSLVERAVRRAPLHLDPDTYVSADSFEVARLAAGGAVELALAVAAGRVRNGLAAVRPPGHHAEAGRAMGFCLFNNVAIAARALQAQAGVERILILDWDVHHGNGTQHLFEEDPSVLYFSTHQFPFYPGTGAADEAGRGAGEGATVNVPLPPGCGDAEHVGALRRVLVPVARRFRPELILVSCGFDAHRDDPLASMVVTKAGFGEMARCTRALAEDLCDGRLVCVLEGGYAASGLEEGTGAVLDVLLEAALEPPGAAPEAPAGGALSQVLTVLRRVHGSRYPDLGSA
jgi:acetoin utilization deacetylase AcuC-like enzyme